MLTPEHQAADEDTSLDRLRELATSSDPVVRQTLVMNPNTPAVVLAELAKQFPRHLFKNPAIDLLLLENPNLLTSSANTLCSLVKRSIAPVAMLKYAANSTDERLQLAVTMNAEMPKLALVRLAQSQNLRVAGAAQMHVNWANQEDADWEAIAEAAVEHVLTTSDEDFKSALESVSKIRNLASEIPENLMQSLRTKKFRISNIQVLERTVNESSSTEDLAAVAVNRDTPVYLLEKLADYKGHQMVPSAVASNPNTPSFILERLIDAAQNPSTPPYHVDTLLRYVLPEVARNRSTPPHLLVKLARFDSDRIRTAVANHPNTPLPLVMELLESMEKDGKYCLLANDGFLERIITNRYLSPNFLARLMHRSDQHNYTSELRIIAAHPNLHSDQLRYLLLDHHDHNIRRAAATNPNVSKYLVEQWGLSVLETIPSYILEIMAQNPDIPDCFLQALLKRQEVSVRAKAIRNPCISDRVLEQWEASKDYVPGEMERALTSEQLLYDTWETKVPASSRLIVLSDKRSPSGLLAKLARSVSWLERYAIAKHPNTPNRIRQRLTQDANHAVRAAAIANSR